MDSRVVLPSVGSTRRPVCGASHSYPGLPLPSRQTGLRARFTHSSRSSSESPGPGRSSRLTRRGSRMRPRPFKVFPPVVSQSTSRGLVRLIPDASSHGMAVSTDSLSRAIRWEIGNRSRSRDGAILVLLCYGVRIKSTVFVFTLFFVVFLFNGHPPPGNQASSRRPGPTN